MSEDALRKTCSHCRTALPLDRFGRSSTTRDGLKPDCKSCRSEQQRKAFAASSEEQREKRRKSRRDHYARYLERERAKAREAARARLPERQELRRNTASLAVRTGRFTRDEDAILLTRGATPEVATLMGRSLTSVESRLRYLHAPQKVRASAAKVARRERRETIGGAVNSGKEWTGPELEILASRRYTAKEAALLLGRTAAAVYEMQRKVLRDPRKARLAGLSNAAADRARP